MKIQHEHIKPFLKWAGGKTQLLEILEENFPEEIQKKDSKIKRYVEPFVGGGALFFDISKYLFEYKFEEIIINDVNSKLINVYKCLQEDVIKLIEKIESLKNEYLSYETLEKKEDMFYRVRESFNSDKEDNFLQAAEFIFLNKTCFNGLYRENSKEGAFNVPFGKRENPGFYDENNLTEISKLLNLRNLKGEIIVKILNVDYFQLNEYLDKNSFVYFDPPYRPITKGGFNTYSKGGFNDQNQTELAGFCREIEEKNCYFLLSNSDPKNLNIEDNFFDDLYDGFNIQRIYAKRNINSKGTGRGDVTELLIKNYNNKNEEILGEKMMDKNFINFLEQLKPTNATLDYFVDFRKVSTNVNKISLKLNQLNYLIGKENMKEAISELFEENPKVFEVLDILIAVRDSKKVFCVNESGEFNALASYFNTPETIYNYILETGLEEIFKDKLINNLVDYVFGIEVGLDTNARKNRGGTQMSNLIKEIFKSSDVSYREEVSAKEFPELSNLGADVKVFDFVIEKENKKFLIEVNFYSSGGSKLNEVARSYRDISKKINSLENFEFVWITDGKGWETAKNKLEEAYKNIPRVYNLTTIKEFVEEVK